MKEVTHEDWLKNPTPRMMRVWGDKDKKEGYGSLNTIEGGCLNI